MELKYFDTECQVDYPIGDCYSCNTYHYVKEVSKMINRTFPEGTLILVARGSSGTILVGGVAYSLSRKGRNVIIAVSRKPGEIAHSSSLASIDFYTEGIFIVIDDFISSGDTLDLIIRDLQRVKSNIQLDMLCVSNYWNSSDCKGARVQSLLQNFKYVYCNKLKK